MEKEKAKRSKKKVEKKKSKPAGGKKPMEINFEDYSPKLTQGS